MIHVKFPIEPVAKGRPRIGRGRAFTPKKTRDFENKVREHAKHHAIMTKMREPLTGPLEVLVMFNLTKPKTVRREVPEVKPDLDNLVKGLFDGCNGVLWIDDAQIVMMACSKFYAPNTGFIDLYIRQL